MSSNPLSWLIPWEPSILVPLSLLLAAVFYVRGYAATHPPPLQQGCFWLGLLGFYAVSFTQFDYYSEHEFLMHRLQHSVLHHIAPFLIAVSRPGRTFAAGAPFSIRRFLQLPVFVVIIDTLNRPVVAVLVFCGLIYFWLIPSIHFIGMMDVRLYKLMNWGMAINGLMFWNLVLNNYCLRPAAISPAGRIAMMLALVPPQIVIGMLIFSSPHELYPLYSLCGRAFGDISALDDQRIGGLILWVPSAMMSVLGMLLVMRREWLKAAPA